MELDATLATADVVRPWRELYRREMNCQIIHDSWLGRGWVDPYLLAIDGATVGYALVGGIRAENKVIVIEYFVLPHFRVAALALFRRMVEISGAKEVETQSNDRLTTLMLYDCVPEIASHVVLFEDKVTTHLAVAGATFRKFDAARDAGRVLGRTADEPNEWLLEVDGEIVAAGGLLFHYNPPYGDIYMEVAAAQRRRGYGSFLVQELKREAYAMGKIPAARCNAVNLASRATLQKAGMHPCGRMLAGVIAT